MTKNTIVDFIHEVVSASPEYALKEKIRQKIQDSVIKRVKNNVISSQKELDDYFMSLSSNPNNTLALTALKSIPFHVWQVIAAKK